jgi:hypothetical protein
MYLPLYPDVAFCVVVSSCAADTCAAMLRASNIPIDTRVMMVSSKPSAALRVENNAAVKERV